MLPLPGDTELARDRCSYWQFVSRVTGKELRREGLDEMVRAGKISAEEKEIMILQQQRLREALLAEQEMGVA